MRIVLFIKLAEYFNEQQNNWYYILINFYQILSFMSFKKINESFDSR